MNTRKAILLLCITELGAGSALAEYSSYSSYHAGMQYTFTIRSDRQARCPRWSPEKESNPPISAAKALISAKKFIATVKPGEDYEWELADLSLVDVYGWAWRANFQLKWTRGAWNGPPHLMQCWILMDGTVVQPTTTPHK